MSSGAVTFVVALFVVIPITAPPPNETSDPTTDPTTVPTSSPTNYDGPWIEHIVPALPSEEYMMAVAHYNHSIFLLYAL